MASSVRLSLYASKGDTNANLPRPASACLMLLSHAMANADDATLGDE